VKFYKIHGETKSNFLPSCFVKRGMLAALLELKNKPKLSYTYLITPLVCLFKNKCLPAYYNASLFSLKMISKDMGEKNKAFPIAVSFCRSKKHC
jgi:hypothetical protein